MVVAERKRRDIRFIMFEVHFHLFRRSDACKQQDMLVGQQLVQRIFSLFEQRYETAVFQCREEQLLIRVQLQGLTDDPESHGLDVFRAFGYDYDIGPVFSFFRFAQTSCGEQLVVANQAMVIY